MIQRKVNNLKKSPKELREKSPGVESNKCSSSQLVDTQNEEDTQINKLDAKKIYNKKNVIEEINSDLDNHSIR